eukprot:TRINITY_DN46188_c0_g1_i1.p1 TRINITY_DN46188_c0_g1~~TRINITY_DN46188_c0_g1_i1.p1  ORF type:complete len:468 (+),score=108.67 TRINITY_DN46188_c0_g1_i1:170-1573(+)
MAGHEACVHPDRPGGIIYAVDEKPSFADTLFSIIGWRRASGHPLSVSQQHDAAAILRRTPMFWGMSDDVLIPVVRRMSVSYYPQHACLIQEGAPTDRFFVIASGSVMRQRTVDGRTHQIEEPLNLGHLIGALHSLTGDPAYASAHAMTPVTAYTIDASVFRALLRENPQFHLMVTTNLCLTVRDMTKRFRTSMQDIQGQDTSITATSLAAAMESFYRSALAAMLNNALTGGQGRLFPNMHVQIPVRIMYINGFKQLRAYFDGKFLGSHSARPEDLERPLLLSPSFKFLIMIAPGLIMTPWSSLLEATNCGHSNPEPLAVRWMRGYVPRTVREVIFGVGLNQMSDFFEERVPAQVGNASLRSALGSIIAGVACGYLSHLPHNLSAMKQMGPSQSYFEHFAKLRAGSEARFADVLGLLPTPLRAPTSSLATVFFPKGVVIRTTQIVGSFIIINAGIAATRDRFRRLGLP